MPKVYENGHKNVLDIWVDSERKVKYSLILVFKVIFLCQKVAESFCIFFIEEYIKRRLSFTIHIFWSLYFLIYIKNGPKFWPLSLNPSKFREHFYCHFHTFVLVYSQLSSAKLSFSNEVTLILDLANKEFLCLVRRHFGLWKSNQFKLNLLLVLPKPHK